MVFLFFLTWWADVTVEFCRVIVLSDNCRLHLLSHFHVKPAQLTIFPPLIYMKISQLWGIVDVSVHTSFELSEGNSSEIMVVQNFYSPEILCKSYCFNGCRIGYFIRREQ